MIKLMNKEYNNYLLKHRQWVKDSFSMVQAKLREYLISDLGYNENQVKHILSELWTQLNHHDDSKYSDAEYNAYNDYFLNFSKHFPPIESVITHLSLVVIILAFTQFRVVF